MGWFAQIAQIRIKSTVTKWKPLLEQKRKGRWLHENIQGMVVTG